MVIRLLRLCSAFSGSLLICRQLYCVSPSLCYQGPEVRSGDLPQPIMLKSGQEFTFTIQRGVGTTDCVSVNYDDFVNDVEVGDMLLVDGMFFCHTNRVVIDAIPLLSISLLTRPFFYWFSLFTHFSSTNFSIPFLALL